MGWEWTGAPPSQHGHGKGKCKEKPRGGPGPGSCWRWEAGRQSGYGWAEGNLGGRAVVLGFEGEQVTGTGRLHSRTGV